MKKLNLFYITYSLLVSSLIIFLIFNNSLYFYINPITLDSEIVRYGDWKTIPDSIICFKQGIDIYSTNPCDVGGRLYIYGKIFLYLPYVEEYYFFYSVVIPSILIIVTIFIINYLLNVFDYKKVFLSLLILFSTPVMLLFERANLELLLFIIFFLVASIKNNFFIHLLLYLSTSIKYYPICAGIIFLEKKLNLKSILNILLFTVISLSIIFLHFSEIMKVIDRKDLINPTTVENVGIIIFSFHVFPELFKSVFEHIGIFNYINIKNIIYFFQITIYLILIFILFNFLDKQKILINEKFPFNEKLFLISSIITIVIFFLNMNYSYKEIYLIGLFPYINNGINRNIKFYKIFKNILLFKFVLLTVFWVIQTTFFEYSIFLKGANILIKNLTDNIIIIILIVFILRFLYEFIKNNFIRPKRV